MRLFITTLSLTAALTTIPMLASAQEQLTHSEKARVVISMEQRKVIGSSPGQAAFKYEIPPAPSSTHECKRVEIWTLPRRDAPRDGGKVLVKGTCKSDPVMLTFQITNKTRQEAYDACMASQKAKMGTTTIQRTFPALVRTYACFLDTQGTFSREGNTRTLTWGTKCGTKESTTQLNKEVEVPVEFVCKVFPKSTVKTTKPLKTAPPKLPTRPKPSMQMQAK